MNKLKVVLLDIDGTLLISNAAHALAFTEAAEALGIEADYGKVIELIGKGSDKLIPEAFGIEITSFVGQKLDRLKGEIFKERFLPHLVPTAGARELLMELKSKGLACVVATSAGKDDVSQLLERAGVKDLVDDAASADDANASKPDRDILQAGLMKFEVRPDQAVLVGDTPYDVEAAARASIRCIAVRCGGWHDENLGGAAAIYDDPADILAHFDQAFDFQDRNIQLGGIMPAKTKSKSESTTNRKVHKVMKEFKQGTLKSGGSGAKVKSRKQAIAIGLSEARAAGARIAKKKT